MFIATRSLSESTREGPIQHQPGAELTRWHEWPYRVRRALLNCEWVAEVPDAMLPEESVDAPLVQEQVAQELAEPFADAFVCELCPGRTFDTLRGLKKHRKMAHAG